MKAIDPRELFERHYTPEPNSGCWLWLGNIDKAGYGRFAIRRHNIGPHRFSLQIATREEGADLHACHRCDTPSCVNPEHLFWATQSENLLDARDKKRLRPHNLLKSHCPRGHPYDDQNTYVYKDGRRDCRICAAISRTRYKEKRK